MAKKIKLGIIGLSEGNGHPYSWSAIFNGYNVEIMADCPWPSIPEYLNAQDFPRDGLGHLGEVTHIWSQDLKLSAHIAKASKIPVVVDEMKNMVGNVDAVLLARDDAENHYDMAIPFLEAGIPIFIDKPLALSVKQVHKILNAQKYEDQVFSCSSLRYARELQLKSEDFEKIGQLENIYASVPNRWETYGIHLVEPIISQFPKRGSLIQVTPYMENGNHCVNIKWQTISAILKVSDIVPSPILIKYIGEFGSEEKRFVDSFSCFKESLNHFIQLINKEKGNIKREETLEIITIIEAGRL